MRFRYAARPAVVPRVWIGAQADQSAVCRARVVHHYVRSAIPDDVARPTAAGCSSTNRDHAMHDARPSRRKPPEVHQPTPVHRRPDRSRRRIRNRSRTGKLPRNIPERLMRPANYRAQNERRYHFSQFHESASGSGTEHKRCRQSLIRMNFRSVSAALRLPDPIGCVNTPKSSYLPESFRQAPLLHGLSDVRIRRPKIFASRYACVGARKC